MIHCPTCTQSIDAINLRKKNATTNTSNHFEAIRRLARARRRTFQTRGESNADLAKISNKIQEMNVDIAKIGRQVYWKHKEK